MNSLSFLHPEMADAVESILRRYSPRGTVTSTYRSLAEQATLRRNFEAGRSRFPAERPGHSTHHTGLAVDFVVAEGSGSPQQRELGRIWTSLGGRWGPGDVVHFEHPAAREARDLGFVRPKWWMI